MAHATFNLEMEQIIQQEVNVRIKHLIEEKTAEITAEIQKILSHEVDSMAMRVAKYYSVEMMQDNVIITVKKP